MVNAVIVEHSGLITADATAIAPLSGETKFCIGLKAVTTTWTGAVNEDWNNAGNWSNGKPTATIKAIFNNEATKFPTLNFPTGTGAAAIEIEAGTKVSLPSGFYAPLGIVNNGSIEVQGTGEFRGFGTNPYSELTGSGTLIFGNSSPGTIEPLYINNTINNSIEVNRTAGINITRSTSFTGSVTLKNGVVTLLSNGIFTMTNPQASITGNADSYINGELKRKVAGSGTYHFPVGGSGSYSPATLVLNSIAGPQNISARFTTEAVNGMPDITVGTTTVTQLVNTGTWILTPDNPLTGGTYNLTLSVPQGSLGGTQFMVLKRATNLAYYPWENQGNQQPSELSNGIITAAVSGLTGFSQFGIGVAHMAVPITLLGFNAVIQQDGVLLNWTTSSEDNNDRFIIERSGDGQLFEPIASVKGKGNSLKSETYSFADTGILSGVYYYRLKQVDFDGKVFYSAVRSVFLPFANTGITVFPNPARVLLNISGLPDKPSAALIYDMQGRPVYKANIIAGKIVLPDAIPQGLYIVEIQCGGKVIGRKRLYISG